ncbi:hypothetical protein EGX98_06260 [Fusobacterium necrophorum]|uniref:Protein kinase n=2 Tax=Fusobacterium necrophorum TaxID=859 RepID=A0AB73BWC5_9FUSO|nr:hypothetical protein [Fusobacterium necrophorum]AYZ73656.1 hypothetical protein EGX98_06260 [Fusobacterium necrophorum]AZW08340.1 hypothetical protein EO219_01120 [Fusobacterium necrophorum subsp. necrophorum]KDE62452.1 hypothetical protein FUSO4_10525 [Fusobacterium necrophorum DJ-1]KDE63346.1 hypothetical protein FUSO3_05490 [Fusobacterium necrophorum BL]KDE65721.1 hypothetical protein FUSO5_04245 [Fusobacterium necrophorum BFTR-1]
MDNIKKFILKSKDTPLVTFEYKKEIVEDIGVMYTFFIKDINKEQRNLFPYSLEETALGLEKWISARKVPKNRQFVNEILDTLTNRESLKHPMDYIEVSFGLSLNDSYWIVPEDGKEYLWKDYNLYNNKFSEILSLIAFTGYEKEVTGLRTSPEYTTNGMLKKCWHKKENGIYLMKGSGFEAANGGKEAYSEFYMSQVAKELGIEHIEYDLEKFQGQLVSSCLLATSEDYGYEPIGNILRKNKIEVVTLDAKVVLEIKKVYKENFEQFEDMMLFDAIIGNTDRHLGNFGMLKNNNTGEILKPFPLFDNGLSMLNDMTKDEIMDKEYINHYNKDKTNAFNQSFDEAIKLYSKDRHISKLIKLKHFKIKKHPKYNLSDEWLKGLENNIRSNAQKCLKVIKEKRNERRISGGEK